MAKQQNRRQAKRQIFNEAKDELKAGGHQIDPFDSYSDSSSSVIRSEDSIIHYKGLKQTLALASSVLPVKYRLDPLGQVIKKKRKQGK